jgi:hypothetical protein
MAEVLVVPNRFRPGVGLPPARVAQRPWLPQHSRHCPVLEAGSAIGYLVYPALRMDEALQIAYAPSSYHVTYARERRPGQWEDVFQLTFALKVGSYSADLAVKAGDEAPTDAEVNDLLTAVVLPQHFGQPPGGVALRGSVDFRTPKGWDTVYAAVVNEITPPTLSVLTVRVETDWYPHSTEFRYVFQPGDMFRVTATQPIGQVFFIPREEPTLRDATKEELAEFSRQQDDFGQEKAVDQLTTPYGLRYSPAYQKRRQGTIRRPEEKTNK